MIKIMLPGAKEWLYVKDMEVAYAKDFAKAYGYEMTKENTKLVSKNPEINELIEKYQPQAVDFEKFISQIDRADSSFDVYGKVTTQYINDIERTCRNPEIEEIAGW